MIVLAYDHRGFNLMKWVKKYLKDNNIEFVEFANTEYDKTDNYAYFAKQACEYILKNEGTRGIFSCGTGIGICIAANRYKGIRAGICHDINTTFLARNDDDINVLVLAGNTMSERKSKSIISKFLNTSFEGGRHIARLELLDK